MQFFLFQNTGSLPIKCIVRVRLLTGKSSTAYSAYTVSDSVSPRVTQLTIGPLMCAHELSIGV